ncbi:MAG: hypothetical protein QM831_12490 [Kofleriaceae bacterium]
MRAVVVVLLLLAGGMARNARADSQIRVDVECEQIGRTKACPAFLLGLIDANKVLLASPRASADVIVYATANAVALDDQLHLRFVGNVAGAPNVIELDVMVDTRMTDDEQRAVIAPVFVRGMALFVAARFPDAVSIGLSIPKNLDAAKSDTTPWGVSVALTGNGSYTDQYRSATSELDFRGVYITKGFRALTLETVSGGLNQQPALTLDDGTVVSLDTTQWQFNYGGEAIKLLDEHWSVGAGSYMNFQDPKGQYDYYLRARGALAWDLFPADDPRGNRLEVFFHLGWAIDRYNIRNDIGERFTQYPLTGIDASGSVRRDGITYGLTLQSDVQLNHPTRRHTFTATPALTVQIGRHIDLNLTLSVTQRHMPRPDLSLIDPSDYQTLSRLSFAEPFSMTGTIGLTIHWDPTNGERNDRILSI